MKIQKPNYNSININILFLEKNWQLEIRNKFGCDVWMANLCLRFAKCQAFLHALFRLKQLRGEFGRYKKKLATEQN